MYSVSVLSHADAMVIIEAIRQRADAEMQGLAVAVVDPHGELIAFLRTDRCGLPPILIAQNKAYAAARERKESKEIGRQSREEGFPLTNFGEMRYPSWGGGVPVIINGQVAGAVGVSGMPESVDIEYAHYGIAALLGG